MTLDEVLLYVIVGCIVAAAVGAGIGYMLRKRIAEPASALQKRRPARSAKRPRKCWTMRPGKRKR